MLGLKLRNEFLGSHMPGTAITLRTSDNQGAAQKSAESILAITYPTTDIQIALKAIGNKRSGRPVVLIGDRGRGKSHIMAVMHHAVASPVVTENWFREWGKSFDSTEMQHYEPVKGFIPISESVHNHEYPLLWNLLFDRHPRGQYYRGQFESMNTPFPPRSLLEKMFEEQPVCLILDEFQTWYNGLLESDPKTGLPYKKWAFNFIQNLSEIAEERPGILIFVVSVLDNQNEAFSQIHRKNPVLVDFRGPTAKQDRQKLLLHRLFENRNNVADADVQTITAAYATERFRLQHAGRSDADRERILREVYSCWPFSAELLELLEDHILLSAVAQETRDLIKILAQVYRSRGESVPVITPADFFVDGDTDEVQTLVDSIVQTGQEKLRQIAQRNLQSVRDAGVQVPNAREIISAIWMRSMSPAKTAGATPVEVHLDITRNQPIDDNAFQAELAALIENSINIHGDEISGGRLWIGLQENPRSKVRACAKNNKLWHKAAVSVNGQIVYPGKDVEHIRKMLRHEFEGASTRQSPSRIIVLGPNWQTDPWSDVDDSDKPSKWEQQVLLIIPDQIPGGHDAISAVLGNWLVKHVQKKRNTVRFLLVTPEMNGLFNDPEMLYNARCTFLCSKEAWGTDSTYYNLHKDFERPLRQALRLRFSRFAVLRTWNFQQPEKCIFDIETLQDVKSEIAYAVEERIKSAIYDPPEFERYILQYAKDAEFIGSVLDELAEPPPPNTGDAIPYLGETDIYENILKIAATGKIALNVGGTWICRRSEDSSDDDAHKYVKQKAFRTGQELRQVQLGLPSAAGGGTVTAPPEPKPVYKPVPDTTKPEIPAGSLPGEESPEPIGPSSQPSDVPHVEESRVTTRKTEQAASGINLSGCFEQWGIPSTKNLEQATIEFEGITVQQIKQILQRIPSTFRAKIAVSFREDEKQ